MIKKIKNFTKKVLSFTLATCLLLSVIPMENIKAVSDVPELDKNDWKLSLSFYDSSYMDGRKALESIDWDASDGSYGDTIGRTIITQISYSNENVLKDYKKGELEIRIPDLTYNNNAQITTDVSVGANKEGQEVYNWDYVYEDGFYIFRNANDILANENFEGTIQIAYSITPKEEDPEKFLDSCIHSFNKNLKAILNNTIESNEVSFNYERTYTHPWQKTKYKLTKDKKQLKDLDNLPPGNNDYVWVQYDFTVNGSYSSKYPFIGVTNMYIKDPLPNGCIVLDENYKEIDSNKINIEKYSYQTKKMIYVGYPKADYETVESQKITNHADLIGTYENETNESLLSDADVALNLADFGFVYSGYLYGIRKTMTGNDLLYDSITTTQNTKLNAKIYPVARYSGRPMDVRFGDDILYIQRSDMTYERLKDNEYFIESITFDNNFKNKNNSPMPLEQYDVDLYVRKAGSGDSDYVKQTTFKNNNKTFNFTEADKIVAYYFVVKGVTDTIEYGNVSSVIVLNKPQNIVSSGDIFNFAYIQVFIDNVLQNPQTIDNYVNFITKEEIASFDIDTYKVHIQRDVAKVTYVDTDFSDILYRLGTTKNMRVSKNDQTKEEITGNISLLSYFGGKNNFTKETIKYSNTVGKEDLVTGFEFYDLLPKGMELTSSKEDIINSIVYYSYSSKLSFYHDGKVMSIRELFKDNIDIKITENWNNTGRTHLAIIIDFSDTPVIPLFAEGIDFSSANWPGIFQINYGFKIPYESYFEYGSTYTNYMYYKFMDKNNKLYYPAYGYNGFYIGYYMKGTQDTGKLDPEAADINSNGNTSEWLGYYDSTITITDTISTHQSVTKQVKTQKNDYTTLPVKANPGENYSYKLKVISGENTLTNVVVYDSIEKFSKNQNEEFIASYGNNKYWTGEFLGIDTSYAQDKGYVVKTYYSTKEKPGNLHKDSSWKLYDETKNRDVKSLAFEFLDENGNAAVIPKNNLVYVIINMKVPENVSSDGNFAYNSYYTRWNVVNSGGGIVDNIIGIKSNTTKVATSEYVNLSAIKKWEDNNNSGKYRPQAITFNLLKDGEIVSSKTINSNNTKVTFDNILLDELNRYSIEEVYSDELKKFYESPEIIFDKDSNQYIIINKLKDGLFTNVSGKKTWINADETPEIVVNLLQNGIIYKQTLTNKLYNWEYTFRNLPLKDKNGNNYIYSIEEETNLPDYTTIYTDESGNEYTKPTENAFNIINKKDKKKSINIAFIKEIEVKEITPEKPGETIKDAWENINLDPNRTYNFELSLENKETGDVINTIINDKGFSIVSEILPGKYIITEKDDMYFDFVDMQALNSIEGINFEKSENNTYTLTIEENVSTDSIQQIKIKNKIEPDKFYEDKEQKLNIFKFGVSQ